MGAAITVTKEKKELVILSVSQASDAICLSKQRIRNLFDAGELQGPKFTKSRTRQIYVESLRRLIQGDEIMQAHFEGWLRKQGGEQ